MQATLSDLAAFLPAEVNLFSMLKFILFFAAATVLIGLVGRFALGKRSGLNHAVSSAMGILFICFWASVISESVAMKLVSGSPIFIW